MGCDTVIRLKGKVEPEVILKFLKENYDKNATLSNSSGSSLGPIQQHLKNCGGGSAYGKDRVARFITYFFSFKDGKDSRNIFYTYKNYNCYENLEHYKMTSGQIGENMVKSETTYLSLGYWGNSVEIGEKLIKTFGGWLEENDCSDKPVIYSEGDGKMHSVRHVTMEDVYEMFGEIVVIDK